MSNWDSNYDFSSNQSQGFYDPQMYNYDAGASDYSASNTVPQADVNYGTPGAAPGPGGDEFSNEPPLLEELGINRTILSRKL